MQTQSHACDSSPLWIALVDNPIGSGRPPGNPRSKHNGRRRRRNRCLRPRRSCDGYRLCDRRHRCSGAAVVGLAGLGLILFAGVTWRARPKLAITPDGLVMGGGCRTPRFAQPDIKIIRITEFRRLGRKARLLEIDTDDGRLFVFSRWDLGADPLDVLDALTAAGYAGS